MEDVFWPFRLTSRIAMSNASDSAFLTASSKRDATATTRHPISASVSSSSIATIDSSSMTSTRRPTKLLGATAKSSHRFPLPNLVERGINRADEARRCKGQSDLAGEVMCKTLLDEARSEPTPAWRPDRWPPALGPAKPKPSWITGDQQPVYLYAPRSIRQSAILEGVGGQLVQGHRQRQHAIRPKSDKRSGHPKAGRLYVAGIGRHGVSHNPVQAGSFPCLSREHIMGFGERREPHLEGIARLGQRRGIAQGLHREELHRRQRILDAMVQLVEQQLAMLLLPLALADVAGNLGCADDLPLRIGQGRNGQRDSEQRTVFATPHGFIVVDVLAAANPSKNAGLFIQPVARHEQGNRLANRLLRRVA